MTQKKIKVDLTGEEAHWLRYALIIAFDSIPEKKQLYLSILEKISQSEQEK